VRRKPLAGGSKNTSPYSRNSSGSKGRGTPTGGSKTTYGVQQNIPRNNSGTRVTNTYGNP